MTYDMTLYHVEYVLLGELAQRDQSGVLLKVLFLNVLYIVINGVII